MANTCLFDVGIDEDMVTKSDVNSHIRLAKDFFGNCWHMLDGRIVNSLGI